MDLGIEVILELFSSRTLTALFDQVDTDIIDKDNNSSRIFALKDDYLSCIDDVIRFLQGKNQTLARQICQSNFLPKASRFDHLEDLDWAFGNMGIQDKAKHLCTLFLEDLSDFIVACVDENFGFSRYAERLGRSANSFDELYEYLHKPHTPIDNIALKILDSQLQIIEPKLVCFSVPFPGNLYSAFRCAQYIKRHYPRIKIAMGGGFPNTELRSVSDVRVFEYFDYISLDDGELPIELLHNAVCNEDPNRYISYKRTFLLDDNRVVFKNDAIAKDYPQVMVGTPDYSDLFMDRYISVIEIANPMHSLWSDGQWLKLTMAHGCYWGKCTFCDISLDYIKNYEPVAAKLLVDRMEELMGRTGEKGFHFVDEAAPPSLMKALALEIIRRNLSVTWWTNIRFEKKFTKDLCTLLSTSGCIAVSGGLEVASDRLLKLIDKGVTVAQVAEVTKNFTESQIMVHAYLMYGYPTQTVQETIDSLEMVRQLFEEGVLQSGFWHQFALTAHSPIGLHPENYGVIPNQKEISFANNDIDFVDKTGIDHSIFSYGLKKSLFNFMHGLGFDSPLQEWFDFAIPETQVNDDFISLCLEDKPTLLAKPNTKVVWLGNDPQVQSETRIKKGKSEEISILTFHNKEDTINISLPYPQAEWLISKLRALSAQNEELMSIADLKKDFEKELGDFELFWYSRPLEKLKAVGLLHL